MEADRQRLWLRLHLSPGIGRRTILAIIEGCGGMEAFGESRPDLLPGITGVSPKKLAAILPDDDPQIDAALATLRYHRARVIGYTDPDFPSQLRDIPDPPALLYVKGTIPQSGTAMLGVVGSRRATPQGVEATRVICRDLAKQRVCLISGLARGIDSCAHQAAIDMGSTTVAILGCGIDRIYPPENARLFHEIPLHGAIISEFPPGTQPLASHFPARNRLISGLAQGVLIAEAARGSGSLITADYALDQGREVFAIPGPITHPNSSGTNGLLKQGAHLVTDAEDILSILFPRVPRSAPAVTVDPLASLEGGARTVCELLIDGPCHIDRLLAASRLTPPELSDILLDLELRRTVQQLPGMHYMLCGRG